MKTIPLPPLTINKFPDEQPVVQNLPASEQQAPEPKKYTGSAIPSRSFRILQAMTTPDALGELIYNSS